MKLIPLDAVVAEIEMLRGAQPLDAFQPKEQNKIDWLTGKLFTINSIEVFLDSLEVKEVDIEKEIIDWWNAHYSSKAYTFEGYTGHYFKNSTLVEIAKHFFELGLRASNPLTDIDISSMQDAYIKKMESRGMKNEEAFIHSVSYVNGIKDVLTRFKAQKGE